MTELKKSTDTIAIFYQLVNLLHQEANLVDKQAQLIADEKLKWA